MSGCPSQSFINRDYINPTDRRPMVSGPNRPIVGRLSAVSRTIFCPIMKGKMSADEKETTQLCFFSSANSFEVLVRGLTSADRRSTIGRLLMKNKPFKLGRLLADHRPTIGRQSADDLSLTDCRPSIG